MELALLLVVQAVAVVDVGVDGSVLPSQLPLRGCNRQPPWSAGYALIKLIEREGEKVLKRHIEDKRELKWTFTHAE